MADSESKGFLLPCPFCGEKEAVIMLNLGDMSSLRCEECSTDFDTEHVENLVEQWQRILERIRSSPFGEAKDT